MTLEKVARPWFQQIPKAEYGRVFVPASLTIGVGGSVGHDLVEVDVRRWCRVAGDLHVALGQADPALPVGDRVMHLDEQRTTPFRETFDGIELPQRSRAVWRFLEKQR